MFKLEFETDNAAFETDTTAEVSHVLREIAGRIKQADATANEIIGTIRDVNGNRIGRYELTQAPQVELGATSSSSCRLKDIVEGVRHLLPEELIDEFDLYDEDEPDDHETMDGIFEEIIDYLNEIAPDDARFGTQEGDGACYGFWKNEPEED
jgi:hypothetical protein